MAGTGPDAGAHPARGLVMRDVADEGPAAAAAGTHGDTCPRCRTPVTVADYSGPHGAGHLICCLACGRVLSVETRATAIAPAAGEPPWSWGSTGRTETAAPAGEQPA